MTITPMLNKIRASVRTGLRRALLAWGYSLERTAPLDARWSDESPRDLLLRKFAKLSRSLVVDVPISRCRSELGEALTEYHPFVATLADGPPASYSGSVLEAYYRQCQPASAAEALGLLDDQARGFAGVPVHARVLPWQGYKLEDVVEMRKASARTDAVQYDYQLAMDDGNKMYGPVSSAKGELEVLRLTRLYEMMSLHGYQRHDGSDGDVTGSVLTEAGGEWCCRIGSGQHRIAVAAALGLASIPVRIKHVPVKREEVMYWPQVAEGRVTPEGALAVFDRTMRGDPPPACQFRPPAPAAAHKHESIEVLP